jgi:hypothetical protein
MVMLTPVDSLLQVVLDAEHLSAHDRVADLHHVEDTSAESLTVETFSFAPQLGILVGLLVLERSDLDGLVNESGVMTMLEQTADG